MRKRVLPAPRKLVHVSPAVQDAAVLRITEGGAKRKSTSQNLIERGTGPRRGAEDVGRQHIRRVRRAVAASQIEPLVAA